MVTATLGTPVFEPTIPPGMAPSSTDARTCQYLTGSESLRIVHENTVE